MNAIANLTPQQLRTAADLQEQIQSLQSQLGDLLGSSLGIAPAGTGRRRKLSAEGLANIRAGARKRWASFRKQNGSVAKPAKRGKMSAAGRARIAAALRARWAAAKRSGRNAL